MFYDVGKARDDLDWKSRRVKIDGNPFGLSSLRPVSFPTVCFNPSAFAERFVVFCLNRT